ncbi:hypothetical protein TIFTF001_046880 [Ficus carica]|uniref:Uncharacterized protein n=1 Tax=Ficus carica TaxID=3494 RepID=A0AA87YUG2_FICCA|nr:hypothetical protein TIFTF001_046880 [Ficus carica]
MHACEGQGGVVASHAEKMRHTKMFLKKEGQVMGGQGLSDRLEEDAVRPPEDRLYAGPDIRSMIRWVLFNVRICALK